MTPSFPNLELGSGRWGDYELLGVLGVGGMGRVLRARHIPSGEPRALKLLKAGEQASAQSLRRFVGEAQILRNLKGLEHIVTVHEAGEVEGNFFIAMELVEGKHFGELIDAGKVSPRAGARVLADIARSLAVAHELGIIHRDLKPENILVDRNSRARLTDFGVAKGGRDTSLTAAGMIIGTFHYMPPEQVSNARDADQRSDVYGLSAILYQVLAGRPPHVGETLTELIVRITNQDPEPPCHFNPSVPPVLDAICMKALARDPEARFQSATAFADALDAWRGDDTAALSVLIKSPKRPHRFLPMAAAGLIGFLLLFGAIRLLTDDFESHASPPAAELSGPPSDTTKSQAWDAAKRPAAARFLELEPKGEGWTKRRRLSLVGRVEPADALVAVSVLEASGRALPSIEVRAREGLFQLEVALCEGGAGIALALPGQGASVSARVMRWRADWTAPKVELAIPEPAASGRLLIRGRCKDISPCRVSVGALSTGTALDGSFQLEIPMPSSGTARVLVVDSAGHQTERELSIDAASLTALAPSSAAPKPEQLSLQWISPAEDVSYSSETVISLRGRVSPREARLMIDGEAIKTRSGRFSIKRLLSANSTRSFTAQARHGGRSLTRSVTIHNDQIAPSIRILAPTNGSTLPSGERLLELEFSEPVSRLLLGTRSLIPPKGLHGSYKLKVGPALTEGLSISAFDRAGNLGRKVLKLKIDDDPPSLVIEPVRAIDTKKKTLKEQRKTPITLLCSIKDQSPKPKLSLRGVELASETGRYSIKTSIGELLDGLPVTLRDSIGNERRHKLYFDTPLVEDAGRWKDASAMSSYRRSLEMSIEVLAQQLTGYRVFRVEVIAQRGRSFLLASFRHPASAQVMSLIPGGSFVMGAAASAGAGELAATPRHSRHLRPFLLGKFEITEGAWLRLGKRSARPPRPTPPKTGVSHREARAWLGRAGLRLPSEAEWEYACDGETKAEMRRRGGVIISAAAERRRPIMINRRRLGLGNIYGLIDMLGNVEEWCADVASKDYSGAPKDGSPQRSGTGDRYVTRGGSFQRPIASCSALVRFQEDADGRRNDLGLRPAASLPEHELKVYDPALDPWHQRRR